MMNFKSDEVSVQVEQSRAATTAFEPDTCGRMNRRGEEHCSSDTNPVDTAAMSMWQIDQRD